jgi:hypothetical protein
MKSRLSHKDAKVIMGVIGTLVMLELADIDDFLEVMVQIEDHTSMDEPDHIDYLSFIITTIQDDDG